MPTVLNRIREGHYTNSDPVPTKPLRPVPVFVAGNETAADLRQHADAMERYELAIPAYQHEVDGWNARSALLLERFVPDLEEEFGVVGNPKAGLLYWKAYDRGHAYGLEEIYSHYSDLVELIR